MNDDKIINALWPVAKAAASHIAEWHIHTRNANHWQFGDPANGGWDGGRYVAAGFAKPGTLEYRLRGGAEVRITDIEVTGVLPEDIHVGPIEPAGPQKVVRADVLPNRNDSLDDVPWELAYRDLKSQTEVDKVSKEVGASLAVGLRQQIGYGSEIAQISGETELTVQMEASFKAAWEREMATHHEHEVTSTRKILIRAMHEAVLERVETVGPARQVIRAQGGLKFGLWLHAPGHFWGSWASLSDFCAMLQGIDAPRQFNEGDWLWLYRSYPVYRENLIPFQPTVYAESEQVREFESASNTRVGIRSEPLTDAARLTDALRLVAMHGRDPELRRLAEAEI